MNEEALQKMLKAIFEQEHTRKGLDFKTKVIDKDGASLIETIIRQHIFDNRDNEIGILQAKVFAYERMISNSNFAPILIKEPVNKPFLNHPDEPIT